MQKIRNFIDEEFSEGRLALLIPIIYAAGIAAYFSLKFEPKIKDALIATGFFIGLAVLSYFFNKRFWLIGSIVLALFSLGFLNANYEAISKKAPKIKENLGVVWLRANIEKVEKEGKFYRLFLKNNNLWQPEKGKFAKEETPEIIRLNVRTKILGKKENGEKENRKSPSSNPQETPTLNQNDYIQVRVILSPPPQFPVYPNGYDFAKYAYFGKIGAVGFSISDVKILEDKQPSFLEKIRILINQKIDDSIENKLNASIAKALVTGERSEIDQKTDDNLRYSGLGHILSISGLHLSIVMVWVYGFIRLVFALIPAIALRFDTKKSASIIAIIFGLFYLLLADSPVPAVRSYLMLTLFFVGILFNREITPMRPVAIAGFIILLVQPHALITVSFQLSFASIISLAGFYEVYKKYKNIDDDEKKSENYFIKSLKYLGAILLTSVIVGFVTGPITAYHFNNIAKYGLFSNMLTIPVISFITMPMLAVGTLLMPVNLHEFFISTSEIGIRVMIWCGNVFGSTDNVIWRIPQMPEFYLVLICIAWLWFFTFTSKIRFAAIPLIISIYIILLFSSSKPDVVTDSLGKFFAIKYQDKYYFYGRTGGFKQKQFSEKLGVIKGIRNYKKTDPLCAEKNCFTENILVLRNVNISNKEELCKNKKIVFNLTSENFSCSNSRIITLAELKNKGTYLAWNNGKTDNVITKSGRRIWNIR